MLDEYLCLQWPEDSVMQAGQAIDHKLEYTLGLFFIKFCDSIREGMEIGSLDVGGIFY